MAKVKATYEKLVNHKRKTALLSSCAAVLGWDKQTYMPQAGTQYRAEQLAELASICHQRNTATEVGEWLAICERSALTKDTVSPAAVNIREWRRRYNKSMDIPLRLVEELARVSALAHQHWAQARRESDFSLFAPWLEKILKLKREEADIVGYKNIPYDALLDDYEPGVTTAHIRGIFEDLRAALVPLVRAILDSPRQPDMSLIAGTFPIKKQKHLGRTLVEAIGFDLNAGRIDTVLHPFCTGIGPSDTRITTRYSEGHFSESLFALLHEAGHGLYAQGLPSDMFGLPMGQSVSLSVHESQSRLWENFVGRSIPFWRYALPLAREAFPAALSNVSWEDFYHAINEVRPSFIRIEADEATYNLHIILRFEIEQALVSGDLQVADVPDAWNRRFEELLGLRVQDDAHGCLQDVHWSFGGFGYFPTYCLGNLYAAQLFAKAKSDLPGLDDAFAQGDFAPLLGWLRKHVHALGMTYSSDALIETVTGAPLSHNALLAHLHDKFDSLYQL